MDDTTPQIPSQVEASSAVLSNLPNSDQSPPKEDPPSAPREIALKTAKLIAWVGGSVGGLTIVLIVIGFLAVSAHDAMLGFPLLDQNREHYIVVGGLFFGRSIIFAIASLLFPKVGSWTVIGLLIIATIATKLVKTKRALWFFLIVLALTTILGEFFVLYCLIRPLQISNLLLTMFAHSGTPSAQVTRALLDNDLRWLESEYGFIVLLLISLFISITLLRSVSLGSKIEKQSYVWRLIRLPAFIILIVCAFLLPRAYGIMTISNEYPEVKDLIRSTDSVAVTSPQSALFLLTEGKDSFLLYEPSSQSIIRMKRDIVQQYRLGAPQPIFSVREPVK